MIEGTLNVDSDMDEAAKCGADIFVSFAGPAMGAKGTVRIILQDFYGFGGLLIDYLALDERLQTPHSKTRLTKHNSCSHPMHAIFQRQV